MAKEIFYKYVNNEKVRMTDREVKTYIMKINGWTTEQYNKQYDILRNKLKAFEAYERRSNVNVKTQSAQALLFKEAKAKKRMGSEYKPSLKMQRIRSFTSVSSGKAGAKALSSERYITKRTALYEDTTYKQFKGLLESNPQAKKIYDAIKDPVKREHALADYANKLNAKINDHDEVVENEAIPFGQTFGSNDEFDFDISDYLD